ncbi:hypothetical protein KI387_012753, partial [Taxus chinensis]
CDESRVEKKGDEQEEEEVIEHEPRKGGKFDLQNCGVNLAVEAKSLVDKDD